MVAGSPSVKIVTPFFSGPSGPRPLNSTITSALPPGGMAFSGSSFTTVQSQSGRMRSSFNGQRMSLLAATTAGANVESLMKDVADYSDTNTEILKRVDNSLGKWVAVSHGVLNRQLSLS